MEQPDDITCLYIDFDAFFANVEKQADPAIRDSPVGVTSLLSDNATLITRCYAAKRYGIKRGMRVFEARALCPHVVIRPARHDLYVNTHNAILKVINQHIPVTRVWSVDEMECTLIGRERAEGPALAERIRAALAETIGPYVTPSIGLGPNQFLAKVAAEMNKPNGLTIIRPEDLPGPLLDLTLTDLPGISSGMKSRLEEAGITDMPAFWALSPKHARRIWGNVEGERMWAQVHGYLVSRPETKRSMFGHSRILSGEWQRPGKARECLRFLTAKAAYRMRREGYTAGAMAVSLRFSDRRRGAHTDFPACDDDFTLTRHMGDLFDKVIYHSPSSVVRGVHVMLHDIVKTGVRSGDLFDDILTDNSRLKHRNATLAMDRLNEKHGKSVIRLGTKPVLPGGYAGAKIAFGRVPDKKDFY